MWLNLRHQFDQWRKTEANVGHGNRPRRHLRGAYYAALWALWVLTGTLFYAYAPESNLGIAQGFYMAVNIGYSIGWGYPAEPYTKYLWFSSFYVILGASLVAVALGFFADKVVEDSDDWFTNLMQKREYEKAIKDRRFHIRLLAWCKYNYESLRAILIWLVWLGIMIMYSMINVGWPFREAQYFAISSLSTGGHWSIPTDSPDWFYAVTGFFAAIGVPIMAIAMASVATLLIDQGNLQATQETINEDVTAEELKMLRRFNLENGDGQVDRAEFIILCMVRMGTDPNLIEYISERFKLLDKDNGGTLSMHEITGGVVTSLSGSSSSLQNENQVDRQEAV